MDLGLEILEAPAVDKWLNGQLQMRQIQKVKLNYLLGRDPIKLDMDLIGKGGEIFVFDMGKPIKITDLANQMIRLSG